MNIIEYLRKRRYKETEQYFQGPCPVHQGDSKTAFVYYKNSGKWLCYSKGCHSNPKSLYKILKIKPSNNNNHNYKWSFNEQINFTTIMTVDTFKRKFYIPSPYLIKRGYSKDILIKFMAGTCLNSNDMLYKRSIIPMIYDREIIGYSARTEINKSPKWWHSKGLNRSNFLFNIDAINGKYVFLCEGPLDVIRMTEANLPAIASLGTQLTYGQVNLLQKKGIEHLAILFDNDEAGKTAKQNIKNNYKELFKITTPQFSGSDPGEMSPKELYGELKTQIGELT